MGSGTKTFDLGDWRVDAASGEIARRAGGDAVRLEPKLMDLLVLFAGSPGRIIGKDEVIAAVWGGRAIGDDTLASAISKLRKALGAGKTQKYIETVPKRGYRLVAEVGEGGGAPTQTFSMSAALMTSRAPSANAAKAAMLVDQGLAALKVPLPQNLAQAQLYFDRAIEADPQSAAAQAGLAETIIVQSFAGMAPASTLLPAAKAAARVATALDPELATGWANLGAAILIGDRDFAGADQALARAIGLDPQYAYAHRIRAFAFAAVGRFPDAEREAREAADLEPFSLMGRSVLMRVLTLAKRWRAVIVEARHVIDLAPQAAEAWSAKGWAHHFLGEDREALAAFVEGLKAWSLDEIALIELKDAFRGGGFEALASTAADLFERQTLVFRSRPLDVAMLRVAADEPDAAFAALSRAVDSDDPFLIVLPWLPHLDRLRNDHRFNAIVERVRMVR
jgi:DNA-binding winged helix-turn-helix (wHTH) protein